MSLSFAQAKPGRSRSKWEISDSLIKQIQSEIEKSSTGVVETQTEDFQEEVGYEGKANAYSFVWSVNNRFKADEAPVKAGVGQKGKTIRFFKK